MKGNIFTQEPTTFKKMDKHLSDALIDLGWITSGQTK